MIDRLIKTLSVETLTRALNDERISKLTKNLIMKEIKRQVQR